MAKNLILLGAPGSGKGTQSSLIVDKLGYSHVSTGNLLRDEIAKESELGKKVQDVMEAGQLVSDELVLELLSSNLDLDSNKYIFDGYPRNIAQSKLLVEQILVNREFVAVYLKVDEEKIVKRLSNRRMTKDGKNIYNLVTNPPKVEGVCDKTGEELIQRDDDKEDVVRDRMRVYNETIGPVVKYFSDLGRLCMVNADQSLEQVFNEIITTLK